MRKREREKNKTGRNWGEKGRPFCFFSPSQLFACLSLPFLSHYPRAWNSLLLAKHVRSRWLHGYWPPLPFVSVHKKKAPKKTNRELEQRRFLATHVNRKWGLFSYNMTWRRQICIAKCLYSHRDDLAEAFGLNYCPWMKKVRFRLTYVAKKTSLLKPRPHAWCVKHYYNSIAK